MIHTHILILKRCRVTNFTTPRDSSITDVVLIKFEQGFFYVISKAKAYAIRRQKHGYLLKNKDHWFWAKTRRYCLEVTISVYLFVYHFFVINTLRMVNPWTYVVLNVRTLKIRLKKKQIRIKDRDHVYGLHGVGRVYCFMYVLQTLGTR